MAIRILRWERHRQLDMAELNMVCRSIAHPIFHAYDDGSDYYVWIAADRPLSDAELIAAYELWEEHQ